jgi:integrase
VELRKKTGEHPEIIKRTITCFEGHMSPRSMNQITTKFIDQFIVRRAKDRGVKKDSAVSPATINKDLRNLKLIFKAAHRWGQLETVPEIQMQKAPKRIKRFVTVEHLAAMLNAAVQMTNPKIPNVTACDYWKAVLGFAFVTGWRISEILNIRRDDVDFESGQVRSRWDDSKGKRDELIFLPVPVLGLLRPVWRNFSERPLEWTASLRTMYEPFTALQKLAGIHLSCEERHEHTDACHVYGFHDFKRAFATYNAASLSAVQLQRLMKHTDFSTTQGYINYATLMTEKPDVFVPDVLRIQDSGKSGTSG